MLKNVFLTYTLFVITAISFFSCKIWNLTASEGYICYIDPTVSSNDFEDGSYKHPFNSWNDISRNNLWKPGGKYLQKCGTVVPETLYFHGLVSGVPGSPVVIGAYGSGERPKVIGNGQYALSLRDCSNLYIQDLNFSGATNKTLFIYAQNKDVYDIKITNCHIDGSSLKKKAGFHCVQIKNEKGFSDNSHIYNIEISHNLIENAGEKSLNCDGLNLFIESNGYIHHNTIQNNSGNGIDLAGGSEHVIEYNKLINNGGTKAHGQSYPLINVVIRDNLVFQENASNYNAFGLSLQDSQNGIMYNNTVYLNNNGMGALILMSPNNPADYFNNLIVNNIFYGSRKGSATIRVFKELATTYNENGNAINNNIIGKSKGCHYVWIAVDDNKRNNIFYDDDNISTWYLKHPLDVFESPSFIDPFDGKITFEIDIPKTNMKPAKINIDDQELSPKYIGVNTDEISKIKFNSHL